MPTFEAKYAKPLTVKISLTFGLLVPMPTRPEVGASNTLPLQMQANPVPPDPGCRVIEPPLPFRPLLLSPPLPAVMLTEAPVPPAPEPALPPLPPVIITLPALVPLEELNAGWGPAIFSSVEFAIPPRDITGVPPGPGTKASLP